jgi:hypothetical protein
MELLVHVRSLSAPCTTMDTPRDRRPDPFRSLDQVPRPDLWEEICQRAQERARVHVALHAPRRTHFAARGAVTLAVTSVALLGGFAAGRHGARPTAAPAAAPVIIKVHDPAPAPVAVEPVPVTVAVLPVQAPTTAPARCLPAIEPRDLRGVK